MSSRQPTALRLGLGVIAVTIVLAVMRPWTIRPIHTSPTELFDAEAYVASIWPRLLEEADRSAVDVTTIRATPPEMVGVSPPTRRALLVTGMGVVSRVELGSRVGLAHVQVEGLPAQSIAIQVGPILRGTALRDALPFIRFTDFPNQVDFAAVASSIHRRVLRDVLAPIDVEALSGRKVSFTGAVMIDDARADSTLEIVPAILRVDGGPE